KRVLFAVAVLSGLTGLWLVGESWSVACALGGYEYGNFFEYAWVGAVDPVTHQLDFADYPTGERPWYAGVSTWLLGFDCLALSVALVCGVKAWPNLKDRRLFFSVASTTAILSTGFVCLMTTFLLLCIRCD